MRVARASGVLGALASTVAPFAAHASVRLDHARARASHRCARPPAPALWRLAFGLTGLLRRCDAAP